jgi:ribosome recycling factor
MDIDKTYFDKAIDHLRHELAGLRTGRASGALVDSLMVDSYGAKTPLAHIATITIPDSRTIAIQPWDKSNMQAIEKAIQTSNLGLNPANDGNLIRLSIPPMTEERRKEMVKVVGQLAEQARIAIRNSREEMMKELKRSQESNEITEDELENAKEDLQKVVDSYNEQIKELVAAKEQEVMTI